MEIRTTAAFVAAFLALGAARAASSPIVAFVTPSDRPDASEVGAIVEDLHSHGFDQFLIYPSIGLGYEYLSPEFFDMTGHFLSEAKKRDMKVWLYDEWGWPSGTARGRVPTENHAFAYRELVATTNASGEITWQEIASRELNVDNDCLDGNNFEPAGVARFMSLTHEAYSRHFKKYLGSTVRGIFTDEPGHCTSAWRMKMPRGTVLRLPYWSGMEAEYAAASGGRDFRADFERAFRDRSLARSDMFRIWIEIRSRRYRKSYFDPIAAWCRTNGIESTGHLIGEGDPDGCARANGLPLNTLSGLTKVGVDLIKSNTDRSFEWLTLAFAQAGVRRTGKPGIAELFALGPSDMTFADMRKLYWLCAAHGIDTYFQSQYHTRAYRFIRKASWAMFTSPDQPWYDEMPLLHAAAKEAAAWAVKPRRCDLAVVYPQRALGAAAIVGGARPDLVGLCRELTWHGYDYELVEENEKTSCSLVLDWDGSQIVARGSGERFADFTAVLQRVASHTGLTPRPGHVRRYYCDGSSVDVDLVSGDVALSFAVASKWRLSLDGSVCRRLWFWRSKTGQKEGMPWETKSRVEDAVEKRDQADNTCIFSVDEDIGDVRFVLRDFPKGRLSLTLDGKPMNFAVFPATSLVPAYNEICRETRPMTLSRGRHVVALSGGTDGKMFMPVAWMTGRFAEREHRHLTRAPSEVSFGSLASLGLADFVGRARYSAEVTFARGASLSVDAGGAVVRTRLGKCDLGARGWEPFSWRIPDNLAGHSLPLEITLSTSVRPIFGSEKDPDAKLDHALWVRSAKEDPSPVGLLSCSQAPKTP